METTKYINWQQFTKGTRGKRNEQLFPSLGHPPPGVVLQEELESVQKRAARFVTSNYNYETGSMTGILG